MRSTNPVLTRLTPVPQATDRGAGAGLGSFGWRYTEILRALSYLRGED